ncbi:glycosyltransferase family 1 protein [Methylobacterium nonmethylotrophicum]|uniref:Glycosyltransferase family 1 protein n=1 Tax=Methylobacterium nonmethylotrophicum TaxID=1141884 RepID=A0A4Z0NPS5_9HYPH|nr:glycosyltransferase family 1 protein [Methylobacterium nonmethylotrophicum]TGD98933.1 glycosyltransferase family 1 protein [Methylobacterium nonmethylotrophicum]
MTSVSARLAFVGNGSVLGHLFFQDAHNHQVTIRLEIDGIDLGENLVRQRGGNSSVWSFRIPSRFWDDETHLLRAIYCADDSESSEDIQVHLPAQRYFYHVDEVKRNEIVGWVRRNDDTYTRAVVALRVNGVIVSRATANQYRGELVEHGHLDGRFGFNILIPYQYRHIGAIAEFGVIDDDEFIPLSSIHIMRSDVKVLIVTDTKDTNNASRYYRAVVQGRHLWQAGAEVAVVDKSEVHPNSSSSFDIVVLQRTPLTPQLEKLVRAAKAERSLVLYETDDLNVFSEIADQISAVRSGFRYLDDPEFQVEMQLRFQSATVADAILVPNNFMSRYFKQRGFQTITSRFSLERRFIKERPLTKSARWKILYMSGSPTHKNDLKEMISDLYEFHRDHEDCDLTVLGHVDADSFSGWDRIFFKPAVTYDAMIDEVSDHDLVLVPFEKTVFNFAKSATKVLESAAAGVPVMASAVPDYVKTIGDLGVGYIVPWHGSWYAALENAYRQRHADHAAFSKMQQFAYLQADGLQKGLELLSEISDLQKNRLCNVA